jgi:hypothetical protein
LPANPHWVCQSAICRPGTRLDSAALCVTRISRVRGIKTGREYFAVLSAQVAEAGVGVEQINHRNRGSVIATALGGCLLFMCLGAGWAISLSNAREESAQLKAQIEEDGRKAAEEERQAVEGDLRKEKVRRQRQDKLHSADIPEIERLLGLKEFQTAFNMAQAYRTEFPDDSKLRVLWQQVASQWVVETEPAGAQVFLRVYGAKSADGGAPMGETPLTLSIAKGFYQWRISRDGCATIDGCAGPESVTITRKLDPADYVPTDMVRVLG